MPRSPRSIVGVALLCGTLALPAAGASAQPVDPVAHAAVLPLAVPVATFILKELAVGALNKLGAHGMGMALAEAGFSNPDTAQLAEIDAKLDRIEVTMKALEDRVIALSSALANARLSAVRHSLRDLVGRIQYGRSLLQKLSDGSITDPTLRAEKRSELIALIRDKLASEQNSLFEGIASSHGNDDILRMSFEAERLRHRFFNDTSWHRAASIVTFYRDAATELLLLRVEYEMSFVTESSSSTYIAERQALAQDLVTKYHEQMGRINNAYPTLIGTPDYLMAVDTKPNAAGHHLVWINDSRFGYSLVKAGDVAAHLNQYQDPLPTLGDFRFLVSGRPSGQTPPQYLEAQNFRLPLHCGQTHTVEWTRDIAGNGARWAWGAHDDGQGQLGFSCMHLRVRQLRPGERYW